MGQQKNWHDKVFSPEQQQHAEVLWSWVYKEVQRLTASHADPAGEEAQRAVGVRRDLLRQFGGDDPTVAEGLPNWVKLYQGQPQGKQGPVIPQLSPEERSFLVRAEEYAEQCAEEQQEKEE